MCPAINRFSRFALQQTENINITKMFEDIHRQLLHTSSDSSSKVTEMFIESLFSGGFAF